jgi:outer membrane lipoprotein SlyB
MRREIVLVTSGVVLSCSILNSCDTPVGQGAGWGAATGAIIGGAATGHVRGAALGAAAGAAAGTLVGAAIQQDQIARYGPPPPGGFPFARRTGRPGLLFESVHGTHL